MIPYVPMLAALELTSSFNSWEPTESFKSCERLLKSFWTEMGQIEKPDANLFIRHDIDTFERDGAVAVRWCEKPREQQRRNHTGTRTSVYAQECTNRRSLWTLEIVRRGILLA